MWEITLSGQVAATLWSVPVGAALCLVYDVLRVLRSRLRTGLLAAVVGDILFFVFAAFVTFCIFLIFCSGQIRLYVFIGLLAGFLLCRFTLSRIFTRLFAALFNLIFRLLALFGSAVGVLLTVLQNFFGKIANFALNIVKKLLQPVVGLLYNLKQNKRNLPDTAPAEDR